jgi:hypothetical protein
MNCERSRSLSNTAPVIAMVDVIPAITTASGRIQGRYAIAIPFNCKSVSQATHTKDDSIFGWGNFHREEKGRLERKIIQFLVNELLFVVSGFIALFFFWISAPAVFLSMWWVAEIDALLLLILGVQLVRYVDFK